MPDAQRRFDRGTVPTQLPLAEVPRARLLARVPLALLRSVKIVACGADFADRPRCFGCGSAAWCADAAR
jgi:hypothetical protein